MKKCVCLPLLLGFVAVGFTLAHEGAKDARTPQGAKGPPKAESDRVDNFGFPLPPGAIARMGLARLRHGGYLYSLMFSPDGKSLASRGSDGRVRIWDVNNGKQRFQLPDDAHDPQALAFSADGTILTTACSRVLVCSWDMATGKQLTRLARKADHCQECILSRDGTTLALNDDDAWLAVWDIAGGKGPRRLRKADKGERVMAVSADGSLVASGSDRGYALRVWEAATGKELCFLQKPKEERLLAAEFSHDGKTLVSGGYGSIYVWDIATGKELRQLPTQKNLVWALAFSPNGDTFASGCSSFGAPVDGSVTLWDASTGKRIRDLCGHMGGIQCLAFSRDGKTLASGGWDHTIRLWNTVTGAELFPCDGHVGAVRCAALSPDGTILASGGVDGLIRLWDPMSGRELRQLAGHRDTVSSIALSSDGKTLISGSVDGTLRRWSVATGKELSTLKARGDGVAFSPDGSRLAWVGPNKALGGTSLSIHLCDAETQTESFQLPGHHNWIGSLAFSADGDQLASSGGNDGMIRLWHLPTGRLLRTIKRDRGEMGSICFSADGRVLAARSEDATVHLWEMDTGREILKVHDHPGESIHTVVFCPGDRVLAIASGGYGVGYRIRFWDTATLKEIRVLNGHEGYIGTLSISADGKLLVSGSGDSCLLAWDLRVVGKAPALPETALGAGELKSLWADLLGEDAARAHRAGWTLAGAPGNAVAFLEEKLRPVCTDTEERAPALLTDLDSEEFNIRDAAAQKLQQLGPPALMELLRGLKRPPSLEFRRRVEQLLARLGPGPVPPMTGELLRRIRAIVVLEHIGTADAIAVLKTLAARPRPGVEAREARAALTRLTARAAAP